MRAALREGGLAAEYIEPALGGMLGIIHAMRKYGKAYELAPGLKEYFENQLRLTNDRIDPIQGLTSRVAFMGDEERSAW